MLRARYASRRALLVVTVLAAATAGWLAGGHEGRGERLGDALATVLAPDGLDVDPTSVLLVDGQPATEGGWREALFRAQATGEAFADIHRAEIRVVPGGIGGLRGRVDLTRSTSADEGVPRRVGDHHVAFLVQVGGEVDAVTVLDLRGEPAAATAGWSAVRRWQNAVSNLQQTGRAEGFGRTRIVLRPPAASATLGVDDDDRLLVDLPGAQEVVYDPAGGRVLTGGDRAGARPAEKGRPGGITWVVDTVRHVTGPAPIAWLEHRVFAARDGLRRAWYAVFPGEAQAAEDAAADLGVTTEEERRRRVELSATDPEVGWPPAPLDPVFAEPLEGEGVWLSTVDDPFVETYPNAPPAFCQTFLRPDPDRGYARVYLTAFDPRQVQLRVMTGTKEPESATGETGPGRVPRDPETVDRLVGGFNGGFQALHGEFGMMSEGRVYLPPKPWAATIGVEETGRVVVGSWLPPPEGAHSYDEEWARSQIPPALVEFRQNLTSVVEDGEYNPWGRWWWGAAPLNAREQTYIDRSGLCLTEEGFLVYFWGDSLGPDALGQAMLRARCVRGVHLDMNSRHTGFEFYRTRPADVGFPALDRELDPDFEFEGAFPGVDGTVLRARRAVRSMTTMRFPRWVGRDPRDFFYLLQKPVLPGPALPKAGLGEAGEGRYDAAGLPTAGWPPAFARAFLGGEERARTWLVRIDPRRVAFGAPPPDPAGDGAPSTPAAAVDASRVTVDAGQADEDADADAAEADAGTPPSGTRPRVLAYLTDALPIHGGPARHALWRLPPGEGPRRLRRVVGDRWGVGDVPPGAEVVLAGTPVASAPEARAAVGLDQEGFVVYAEQGPDDETPLADRLRQAGVDGAVALPLGARLALLLDGRTVGPDAYERPVTGDGALAVTSQRHPEAATVLFEDVEPKGYWTWARLQDARVRYFREGPPRFTVPSDAGPEDDAGAGSSGRDARARGASRGRGDARGATKTPGPDEDATR